MAYQETSTMTCEECGNHSLVERGGGLLVCDICGALGGDDDAVRQEELAQRARAEGYDVEVYPLVLAIERLKGVSVERASGGDPFMRIPPFLRFTISDNRLTHLDNLMHSLELSRRTLKKVWTIHVGLERGVYFDFMPLVSAHDLNESDVEDLQADLVTLAKSIKRDQMLTWWRG